jgi:RluA family pseudouridine synthase
MPLPPILFEDAAVIVFDKPGGLPVGAERGAGGGENLMALVQAQFGTGIANVHRLDPEASGLVLCARTKPALDYLSGQFQSKTAVRTYLALVAGVPTADEFTVELVMKEDEGRRGTMCVVKKHGQPSRTEFSVRDRFPGRAGRAGFAWVECRPHTGRPHQIRLHLSTVGTPVLNDPIYGNETRLLLSDLKRGYKGRDDERPLIERLALHAAGLTFNHPATRASMTVTAPVPKDLAVALKYLQKFRGAGARG